MENIRWRGHKWQISVYINLFQKPQINSVLTYHRETEGLAIGICIRKYWEHTQESPITVLSEKSVSLSHQYILMVGGKKKKKKKLNSVCTSNSRNLFPNMWGKVPRSIQALCSSCRKSQQTCDHSHLRTAATYMLNMVHGSLAFFLFQLLDTIYKNTYLKTKSLVFRSRGFMASFSEKKRACLSWTEIMVTLLREGDANRTKA